MHWYTYSADCTLPDLNLHNSTVCRILSGLLGVVVDIGRGCMLWSFTSAHAVKRAAANQVRCLCRFGFGVLCLVYRRCSTHIARNSRATVGRQVLCTVSLDFPASSDALCCRSVNMSLLSVSDAPALVPTMLCLVMPTILPISVISPA